ncbi:carboxypeptidase-like regulatory domain-containing protein [Pedobacter endophyticus]|uniref:carboxypeptidase-like regulatory domain-containing protein n=1 Tax=Pedobacter endophyticus TaxID=2789740 RepID=UPI001E3CBE4F|nr:carboxypeptidase-like regulatory domain-containing protein [Pedobacter endophyticus]
MKKLLQSLFILMFVASSALAQERTITGTVTSQEDGLPIPGATVRVKEIPNLGAQTNADGQYSFTVPSTAKTFVFSYLGYRAKEMVLSGSSVLNVALVSDVTSLNEVVVTAGGISIQRRQQGNQSTTVKAEELTQGKAFNVASALTGKVAGLQVNAVSSGVNPSVRLVLRGNRSLLGNNQALVVVDNVIVPSDILGNLNPEDIESIEVLNGAGAAALYGSDASNGALIIQTKKGKRGASTINVSHTTNIEQVSFLPQLQERFGSGTGNDDIPTYTPYENQQYGPASMALSVQLASRWLMVQFNQFLIHLIQMKIKMPFGKQAFLTKQILICLQVMIKGRITSLVSTSIKKARFLETSTTDLRCVLTVNVT